MASEIVQRYQIKEKIGAGGMGTVYRAWDSELERDVALKWLPAYLSEDENFSERFKQEIRVISHLEHPHIVPIYDVGESEGRPFIIMRLLDGGTLRDKILGGSFNLAELVKATEQISEALTAAHARQIIHRDIKPGNILFDSRGSAFLSDFGIAKVLDSGSQLTGTGFIGTPAYMSPEQFTGHAIDGRSDQYSLAVVVYEALTGALPFAGNTAQMMYKHINVAPADIDLDKHPIPSGLNPILQKSLSKEPTGRYARVADFSTAMAIAMRMEPTTSSVLLPIRVGAPSPAAQRPPTAPTAVDTSPEQTVDVVGDDYRAGLEALALGKWAAALTAFNRVLAVVPDYGSAAEFSKQAQAGLDQAAIADKTSIEAVPVAAAAAAAAPANATVIEPAAAAPPPAQPAAAVPSSTPDAQRKIPIWAIALLGLLLLLGGGFVASQFLGGEEEPSTAGSETSSAAAAVVDTAAADPAAEAAAAEVITTSTPLPTVTPLPAIVEADEPPPAADDNSARQAAEKTPQPIIAAANTEPTEAPPTEEPTTEPTEIPTEVPTEEPTEEPTEVPAAQPAAVRVIVSSANLRSGPGTIYPTAGAIFANEEAAVLASNQDRTWYNVELADGRRAWLAASVTEPLDAAAMNSVVVAATIPAAPTRTPVPPTATPLPTLPPPPPPPDGDGGGDGGGGDGGGDSGGGSGGSDPKPKYTAEPP